MWCRVQVRRGSGWDARAHLAQVVPSVGVQDVAAQLEEVPHLYRPLESHLHRAWSDKQPVLTHRSGALWSVGTAKPGCAATTNTRTLVEQYKLHLHFSCSIKRAILLDSLHLAWVC